MKLAIGYNLTEGPWGGGNQFGNSLVRWLRARGWDVVFTLDSNDIDLILLVEPRKELKSCSFNHEDIIAFRSRNPDVLVVHRINECDERKGTTSVNAILMEANRIAHHTIFISDWLKGLFAQYRDFNGINSTVIRNGADNATFNNSEALIWDHSEPLRLVTHHWGGNWMKGFDVYEYIDEILRRPFAGCQLSFTYIGNVPTGFRFKNACLLAPLAGRELAQAIKQNHVYITASQNEPGGMHHIEGCLCGLPPIYRESGALTEHCSEFGEGFATLDTFTDALQRMIANYSRHRQRVQEYPYSAERMCRSYEELFLRLLHA